MIGVHLHKSTFFFNFIFIVLVTSFNFEAQIIYMWSLKLFKVSECLCVNTLDIICSSKFATNCVDHSLPTPKGSWHRILTYCPS